MENPGVRSLNLINEHRLVIVMRRTPRDLLIDVVGALGRWGVVLVETTYDHLLDDPIRANVAAMTTIRKVFGSRKCIGAGTVLSVDEVHAAHDAGAQYIVAPNFNGKVVDAAKQLGMTVIPVQ